MPLLQPLITLLLRSSRVWHISLLLLLSIVSMVPLQGQVREQDSLALVELYNATSGPLWTNNTNWLTTIPVDEWYGVTVSSGTVTLLDLSKNRLRGTLPTAIGDLTALTYLDLSTNDIAGSIPITIGQLRSLTFLGLAVNQLTGSLPADVGDLSELQTLSLSVNFLSGPIPPELGNLSKLHTLWLQFNFFTGTIPTELGNLTSLIGMYLDFNRLEGVVPTSLASLPNLRLLSLRHNRLTELPDLSAWSDMLLLELDHNRFTFEDIEPNLHVSSGVFTYAPQDSVGSPAFVERCEGTSFEVTIEVGGQFNRYQWFRDGEAVSQPSPSPTLTIATLSTIDAGDYTCQITNTAATALTLFGRPTRLHVADRVAIVEQPRDRGGCFGGTTDLVIDVIGEPPLGQDKLRYQWFFQGEPIPGATAATLTLTDIEEADFGFYTCQVTGECNAVMSEAAELFFIERTEVTLHPTDVTVCAGENAGFIANGTGTPFEGESEVRFQWYFDGKPIPGATERQLFLPEVGPAASGEYHCVVGGACNENATRPAVLFVNVSTVARFVPQHQYKRVPAGGHAILAVHSSVLEPERFAWYRDGQPLLEIPGKYEGTTSSTLTVLNADANDESQEYSCIVWGRCGIDTARYGSLLLGTSAILVADEPEDITLCEGETLSLAIQASSSVNNPLTYQWWQDGQALDPQLYPSATSATLEIAAVTSINAGSYVVRVRDEAAGISIESFAVVVTVLAPPVIEVQPVATRACRNAQATLAVQKFRLLT